MACALGSPDTPGQVGSSLCGRCSTSPGSHCSGVAAPFWVYSAPVPQGPSEVWLYFRGLKDPGVVRWSHPASFLEAGCLVSASCPGPTSTCNSLPQRPRPLGFEHGRHPARALCPLKCKAGLRGTGPVVLILELSHHLKSSLQDPSSFPKAGLGTRLLLA